MNKDISEIIAGWPYEPGEIIARIVEGRDGKPKLQFRLDLGLLQMETEGRPDGARPHEAESLLDFHEDRLRAHVEKHGDEEGFRLIPCICTALREEGLQYYFRYLAMFSLGEFVAVERDASRNLRLFDFVRKYAAEPADRMSLEVYRPYVLMMMSRARALREAACGRTEEGIAAIDEGLTSIRDFLKELGQEKIFEDSCEVCILQKLRKELAGTVNPRAQPHEDSICRLKKALAGAIDREQFEDAARLRDEIHQLEIQGAVEDESRSSRE